MSCPKFGLRQLIFFLSFNVSSELIFPYKKPFSLLCHIN